MVYILDNHGQPLMPTIRHGKVRHLLKQGKAKVVKSCPFTIQLTYKTENHIQPITLGVDAGSKVIGLSASTKKRELYSAEVQVRNDIVDLISTRRELRRTRRNRKTRYRQPRFNNRVKSKHKGWLAPSIEAKIHTHLKIIEDIHNILPIDKIIVEVASFDIQKIKNPDIEGAEYQQGPQLGFWNVREYVLFRDGHTCQHCKGKSKDKILNVHHIESRKTGGDSPDNLITLCETCHKAYHRGEITLKVKRGKKFNDAAFMGIMRWAFYDKLKETYPNVSLTYGYITKNTRITSNLPKEHRVDALCIAGNSNAKRLDYYYFQRKIRRHNRQIHKVNPKKGYRRLNQAPFEVFGFRLFDKVKYKNQECFISARRQSGYFKLIKLDGQIVHESARHKDIILLNHPNAFMTEIRANI